jgi:hypothetical protein
MSARDEACALGEQIAALRQERDLLDASVTTKQAILQDLEHRTLRLATLRQDSAAQHDGRPEQLVELEARLCQTVREAVAAAIAEHLPLCTCRRRAR